jgi:hypothetical protein
MMTEINKYSEVCEERQSVPDQMPSHGRPDWACREHMAIVEEIVALYRDGAFPVSIYPRLEKLDNFWHEKNFPCVIPHGIREKRRTERDAEAKAWWEKALPDKPGTRNHKRKI